MNTLKNVILFGFVAYAIIASLSACSKHYDPTRTNECAFVDTFNHIPTHSLIYMDSYLEFTKIVDSLLFSNFNATCTDFKSVDGKTPIIALEDVYYQGSTIENQVVEYCLDKHVNFPATNKTYKAVLKCHHRILSIDDENKAHQVDYIRPKKRPLYTDYHTHGLNNYDVCFESEYCLSIGKEVFRFSYIAKGQLWTPHKMKLGKYDGSIY
jgi:hypothetical protein